MEILLPIHIVGAALGLVTGAMALAAAKGSTLHRKAGILFVYAMMAMCLGALAIAAVKGQTVNLIAGSLTAYLVLTALNTVRPARSRARDVGLMLAALGVGLTALAFGFQAIASGTRYGYPAFPFFLFGTVGVLGSLGDFRMIRSGGLRGARRLARHLWRMCFALWIATASFFSIRSRVARVLPSPFQSGPMRTLPIVLVLVVMFYWLWRVRSKRRSVIPAMQSA